MSSIFAQARKQVDDVMTARIRGEVADVVGLTIECDDFAAPVGAMCEIQCRHGNQSVEAEVVGFRDSRSILMPYGPMRGFSRGDSVRLLHSRQTVPVGDSLIGRVLDARGRAMDNKPEPFCLGQAEIYAEAPSAMARTMIEEPITTGVKTVDGLFTCGRGQRMGIFSGSGVGKSTLLGMITRNTDADVVVLGLVGERGRELREFLENDLGEEGLKRSVVICATSDQPPLLRVKAAFTATAVAEYFRAQGKNVLLLMDSLTRMAMAQREIGLSAGEPPTTKGYPPSVFNMMPRLLERAGACDGGSITAFYTVLVEGDDVNEPIADTVRGIIDGHIWLLRSLANKGHYPAIGVGDSISRLMSSIAGKDHIGAASRLRELFATYTETEDLINIGAYRQGTNPTVDEAISLIEPIRGFLRQETHKKYSLEETIAELRATLGMAAEAAAQGKQQQKRATRTVQGQASTSPTAAVNAVQQERLVRPQATQDVGKQRLVNPAAQRMPDQQPPAAPGAHPIQAPQG